MIFPKYSSQLMFYQAGVLARMSCFMACAYENCEIDTRICQCEYTPSVMRRIFECVLLLGVNIPCLYCLVFQILLSMIFTQQQLSRL